MKLSNRSASIPESGIRSIYNLARQHRDVISFTLGEPDFETPEHVRQAAIRAIHDGYTRYTPGAGFEDLREAIATKVRAENGIEADPQKEIIATPGAMGALSLAICATVGDRDEVLIPDPGYVSYAAHVRMAGGTPVLVPLHEKDGFVIQPEEIRRKITPKTRALVLNYPANPTGSTLDRDTLDRIAEIANANDLTVISDEVYERIVYDGASHCSIASLDTMRERAVSIFSLSKTYAMTGWRIGYAVGPEHVIREMAKLQEHVSAHPTSISQKAAVAALTCPQDCVGQFRQAFTRCRDLICSEIRGVPGLSCVTPHGAFYVFMNIRSLSMPSRDAAMFFLEKARVAMVPGVEFGPHGEGYLRISYATGEEHLKEGMGRVSEAVNRVLKS